MKLIYSLIGQLCMLWWTFWSNIRFRHDERFSTDINTEDTIIINEKSPDTTNIQIRRMCSRFYSKFTWTADGADQLWDAITPPPQNYKYYLIGHLEDDCDGFHSLVYHCLKNSGIECYLLTANTLTAGHCILTYRLCGKWYVIDYNVVYGTYASFAEAVEAYNYKYSARHDNKKVLFNGVVGYRYDTGKFYVEKKPKN